VYTVLYCSSHPASPESASNFFKFLENNVIKTKHKLLWKSLFSKNDNTNEIINFGKSGPSSQRLPEIRVKKYWLQKNTVGAA